MQIGLVGLGRMGGNIARRLTNRSHSVVAFDEAAAATKALAQDGIATAKSLEALAAALNPPRHVWVMVPAGDATERTIEELSKLLSAGDAVLDGGNTFWRDDLRRAETLRKRGIHHLDVGTSGGVLGREAGYCLMIGGDAAVVSRLTPIFEALAPPQGWLHVGPNGAGHFVKMIHNGIEYGMMQAFAEGFQILKETDSAALPEAERFKLDIAAIAELWRHGSIVSSTLLDVTAPALAKDASLAEFCGAVDDTGEGRWTVQTAIERAIPAMSLTNALYARFRSRREQNFADKVLSAMRKGFGGHVETKGKK